VAAVAVNEARRQCRHHLVELAGLGHGDELHPPLALLGRVGPCRGVEQRELADAFGGKPQHGEGDVAAIGQPGERETRRSAVENAKRLRVIATYWTAAALTFGLQTLCSGSNGPFGFVRLSAQPEISF